VSEIGIGTWEIAGDVWGPKDDAESIRAIQVGFDAGATFIDTAAGYGSGHAETLVGKAIKQSSLQRGDVVISTKVLPKNGRFAPPPGVPIEEAYPAEWIRQQCEESLQRLGTDYVDILFAHTWSRAWGHETAWHQTFGQLKQEGKIKAIGISIPDEGIADANANIASDQLDVVQCVYNVFQQEPEHTLLHLAEKHGVGVIARSPFSSGVLVQDWAPDMKFVEGDWRASWPLNVKQGWLEDQIRMAVLVKPLFQAHGLSSSQACLQYVLSTETVSSVIPGSASPSHVAENMAAARAPSVPPDLVAALRSLWVDGRIAGTYNGSI
jgi:aryl-alcohol dehydrogenase-like predicted oxidoreductase